MCVGLIDRIKEQTDSVRYKECIYKRRFGSNQAYDLGTLSMTHILSEGKPFEKAI